MSASADMEDEDSMDMECAICMEAIGEGTTLPCQCRLDYCLSCWDKALASSYCQRGQATCPSCRTLVRVDFDTEKQCLVFSAETVDITFAAQRELAMKMHQEFENRMSGAVNESNISSLEAELTNIMQMRQDMITRLRHQAQPVQVKLLQGYGKANPSLLDINRNRNDILATATEAELQAFLTTVCVERGESSEKTDLIARLEEKLSTIGICCLWASQKCSPPPKCICGCAFQRINGVERYRNCLGDQAGTISEEEIERRIQIFTMQGQSAVICDLCEENIPLTRDSFVWTCENKNSSILHATSYDICDKCFVEAVCLENARVSPLEVAY